MCKKLMKSSFFENISKLVVTPNYDKYTDGKWYCLPDQEMKKEGPTLKQLLVSISQNSWKSFSSKSFFLSRDVA